MNKSDLSRNAYMLRGSLSKKGYMRWWHSFGAVCAETGERRVFFIEYLIMNPALGGAEPVLGQLPSNRKRKRRPSYVLIKAGAFGSAEGAPAIQLHGFYPIAALKAALEPLVIQVAHNFYSENHISGSVEVSRGEARRRSHMCSRGYMEWDLEVHKAVSCHTGRLSAPFFCAVNALETFWHGEGIRTQYRGTVNLDGTVYEVTPETSAGYADKHWGRSFNRPWLQLAAGRIRSRETGKELRRSALAVDGCTPKFLCFPLKRRLLLQLTLEGEDFDFFLPSFRSPVRTKWKKKETGRRLIWQVVAKNKNAVIKLTCSCRKEEMLAMNYETTAGARLPGRLLAGGTGEGTLLLYRRTPGGKQLEAELLLSELFCEYGDASAKA